MAENWAMAATSQDLTDEELPHSCGGEWGRGIDFNLFKLLDKHLVSVQRSLPYILVKGPSIQAREWSQIPYTRGREYLVCNQDHTII